MARSSESETCHQPGFPLRFGGHTQLTSRLTPSILARRIQRRSSHGQEERKIMKLRTSDPWMPATQYSRSLQGLTLNLLVRDIAGALPFHREVLGAVVVYSDPDFAVLRHG